MQPDVALIASICPSTHRWFGHFGKPDVEELAKRLTARIRERASFARVEGTSNLATNFLPSAPIDNLSPPGRQGDGTSPNSISAEINGAFVVATATRQLELALQSPAPFAEFGPR